MSYYLDIIKKFIDDMEYRNNEHYLGTYFYGSSLTGFDNANSDIDLHIVFDDNDRKHIYRGISYVDGKKLNILKSP